MWPGLLLKKVKPSPTHNTMEYPVLRKEAELKIRMQQLQLACFRNYNMTSEG